MDTNVKELEIKIEIFPWRREEGKKRVYLIQLKFLPQSQKNLAKIFGIYDRQNGSRERGQREREIKGMK